MATMRFLCILYVFTIDQVLTGDCPIGFNESSSDCYIETEETTFPPSCPFTVTTYSYTTRFSPTAWLNVQREPAYGFLPAPILNNLYGQLIWPVINMEPRNDFQDCVIGNRLGTANCNDKHRGLCVYEKSDRHFCESYDRICNDSQHNCHCQSKNVLHICQVMCEQSNHQECSSCDQKFARYPEPEINLVFNGIDRFRVDIIGPLKLIPVLFIQPVYCFSNVYEADAIMIRHRHQLSALDVQTTTKWTYTFPLQTLAVGLNWCEGFTYENHRRVVSNKIMAGIRSAYGLNFVINATTSAFTLTPYTLHREVLITLRIVLGNFDSDKVQLIRLAEFPELYNNRSTADFSYHLTTFPHVADAEYEFNELSSLVLPNCDSLGFKNCTISFSDFCLSGTTPVGPGLTASWPQALLGQQIMPREFLLRDNGLPITRRCLGAFMTGAYWSDVIGEVSVRRGSNVTEALYELMNSNQTAEELNEKLRDIISNAEDLIPLDVYLAAKIFEIIAQSGEDFNIDTFVENMNVIMETDSNILQLAQNELNATDIILYSLDIALGALGGNTTTTITSKNIMAQVTPLNISWGIRGIAVYHQKGEQTQLKNLTNVTTLSHIDFDGLQLAVFIPPELLKEIYAQTETPSLVTTVFLSDTLFRSNKYVGVTVKSAIVGVFVTNFIGVHLPEPLPIIFAPNSLTGRSMYCGFWNFGINDVLVAIHGRWQKEHSPKIYHKFKACSFNHMTHFAILANAPRNRVLDLISLIGCAISTLGVVGIVVTAMAFRAWRNCTATKILLNLSLTILIQMSLLFLSHVMSSTWWCTILAISLHYIIISQFSWMFVIGYLQYRKFVQVLVEEPACLLLFSSIFAWLTPALPVVVIFLLDENSYVNPPYCFLSGWSLHFGVFLPIGLVVVSNLTIFVLIFASLSCSKARAFGTGQNTFLLRVRLSFILFFLLGFSWIFGLLSYVSKSIILSYMFCVTSTVQGFVLYVYFVVCNKRTRMFWARNVLCCLKTTPKTDSPFITKSK